jgi:hypothetical protein
MLICFPSGDRHTEIKMFSRMQMGNEKQFRENLLSKPATTRFLLGPRHLTTQISQQKRTWHWKLTEIETSIETRTGNFPIKWEILMKVERCGASKWKPLPTANPPIWLSNDSRNYCDRCKICFFSETNQYIIACLLWPSNIIFQIYFYQ